VGVTGIDCDTWHTDEGAELLARHSFDASTLSPQVAAPHSPAKSDAVGAYSNVAINMAYIGACTGAKLDDLRMAAAVLRGRRAAKGVRLMVAPASAKDQKIAEAEGTLGILMDAGAELLPNACNACAGYGNYLLDENAVTISTTARNFKGRMGSTAAQIYLGSPYTVAASAITGRIADPREWMA
jgi:3-isopropylmalate/(R)-2-methylmalate dehydratase large subunit